VLEYEHIDILVVAVRRLSRRWKVKTLLAGPSSTSPMRRRLPTPLFPTDWREQAVGWFDLFWVGLGWVEEGGLLKRERGRGCCCSSLPNVSTRTRSFLDGHSTRKPFE